MQTDRQTTRLRSRLRVALLAPVEVIGLSLPLACEGAWKGWRMGCENVRDAWRG